MFGGNDDPHFILTTLRQIVSPNAFLRLFQCEFAVNLLLPSKRSHLLSVERVYILVKGDRGRGRS